MPKIYTRTGDHGFTKRLDGEHVPKNDIIVELNGIIDELNCLLGIIRSYNKDLKIEKILKKFQSELFIVGVEVSSNGKSNKISYLNLEHINQIEKNIDWIEKKLDPLTHFILPAGNIISSYLHYARAKSRSIERKISEIKLKWIEDGHLQAYFNRLSDVLFVMARYVNKKNNVRDEIWNN